MKKILIAFLMLNCTANAQQGCTDPQATNYSSAATINDGSCIYPFTSLPLITYTNLQSPLLNECSGIINVNNQLWVQLDNTALSLYHIDSITTTVFDSVSILNTINTDWEDLAADSSYIYIGDVGNNFGNRMNLHLLRLPVASLDSSTAYADTITYFYSDQFTFTSSLNNTPFDCESFFIYNDSVHLFTKDWVTKWTKHYVMPRIPGTYVAELVDSMNTGGLITSADILNDSIVVLLGYNIGGASEVFVWMLSDFQPGRFFSGNKRKLTCGSFFTLGQAEGIILNKDLTGFITNENVQSIVLPQLKKFSLMPYFSPSVSLAENEVMPLWYIINQSSIEILPGNNIEKAIIYNVEGKLVLSSDVKFNKIIDVTELPNAVYLLVLVDSKQGITSFKFIR